MNLHEAKHLAGHLMREHGLSDWKFRFDHARRRFGSCQPTRKTITLSRPLTLLNPIDQVRDTLLHEIAHALTPGDNHGAKWKAMCRKIGAKPSRCYEADEVTSPPRRPARYKIGCEKCGLWVDRRKVTRRELICRKCGGRVVYHDQARQEFFIVKRTLLGRWSIQKLQRAITVPT